MTRPRESKNEQEAISELLFQHGPSAPDKRTKLGLLRRIGEDASARERVDGKLLDRLEHQHRAIQEMRSVLTELQATVDRLNDPPWFTALFTDCIHSPGGPRLKVWTGAGFRLVQVDPQLDPGALTPGRTVYLNGAMSCAMAMAGATEHDGGEICRFERDLRDGTVEVSVRDERFVACVPDPGFADGLTPGTPLLWCSGSRWIRKRVPSDDARNRFLESTPSETFDGIGGMSGPIEAIKEALTLHLKHPDVAARYGLRSRRSVLLCGPPGTGKTMLARALANWLAGMPGSGECTFINVKPASLHSVWYSESERAYRDLFAAARESARADCPVVLFFDEVDTIGGARGLGQMRVHDSVLTTFMTELDGFESRGHVVVVGATNRREDLDPALLRPGRLGDLILEIPRPRRSAALDILGKYLTPSIPYARNGHSTVEAARSEFLQASVSRIFAPNGEGTLVSAVFRDGSRRAIGSRDLVSGSLLAQVANNAFERACRREVNSPDAGAGIGLRWDDLDTAIRDAFRTAAGNLTAGNVRRHVSGLPGDLDIVRLERHAAPPSGGGGARD